MPGPAHWTPLHLVPQHPTSILHTFLPKQHSMYTKKTVKKTWKLDRKFEIQSLLKRNETFVITAQKYQQSN